jgi:hypothetical protein
VPAALSNRGKGGVNAGCVFWEIPDQDRLGNDSLGAGCRSTLITLRNEILLITSCNGSGGYQRKNEAAMSKIAAYHTLGNENLLALHKIAFLCSRNCPAAVARKSRDWAIAQREKGSCVISGFHSRIEKEVLYRLLEGTQPIIVALARGIMKKLDPDMQAPLDAGRLLIVTRYAESVTHACEDSCFHRNRLMLELADETVIAYASPGGSLERLCGECPGARITTL